MRFPMSPRWTLYVVPKLPKRAEKCKVDLMAVRGSRSEMLPAAVVKW